MLSLITLASLLLPITTASPILVGSTMKALDEKTPLRILPLGDSITWGAAKSNPKQGTNGYRAQLQKNLQDSDYLIDFIGTQQTGTMVDKDNEGHPGFRIRQIHEVAAPALAMKPDVVLIHAATNDLLQANNTRGETWEGAAARLGNLIDYVFSEAPDALVLVAQIIQSGRVPNLTKDFNSRVPSMVYQRQRKGKKVLVVDQSVITPKEMYDGVHPTPAGYVRMGDIWAEALKSADKKGLITRPTDLVR